jgi:FAD/FMN-containing dehydrogenase
MKFIPSQQHLSWGRVERPWQDVARPAWLAEVDVKAAANGPKQVLVYGLGRSYGDSCLNAGGALIDAGSLNNLIAFDRDAGIVRAEAGVSLADILKVAVPAGFFLPVTPGTKFVTLGGAVANDVHGKNHHAAGTFGRFVRALELWRSDGSRLICSPGENAALFNATVGGLGLTGFIAWVELQLTPIPSSYIVEDVVRFENLAEFFALEKESAAAFPYTVSWVDVLATGEKFGRGVFFRGKHAEDNRYKVHGNPKAKMPFDTPPFVASPIFMKVFNEAFYRRHVDKQRQHVVHYEPFFYPLDFVGGWNKAYGKKGFYQLQFVLPEGQEDGFTPILKEITASGRGSFLSVLKRFGDIPSPGMLSFPRPGINLAIDFANTGAATLSFLQRLDDMIAAAGGRVYPAKDGAMLPRNFRKYYPNWEEFAQHVDPRFSSSFWRRVTAKDPA